MSVHGICFDEGQSGNCGLECRGFIGGECDIPQEIAEIYKEELFAEEYGILKLEIMRRQTRYPFNELKALDIILEEIYGYK